MTTETPESRFAPGQECEHGQLARSCGLCDRDCEITELRAQVAQYKEDAERYRWLRVQPNDTTAPRIDVVHWQQDDTASNSGEGLRMEALDAAIDKARKP